MVDKNDSACNANVIIKPCAVCGGVSIYLVNMDGNSEIRCLECGEYIEGYSKENVIKMWNGDFVK